METVEKVVGGDYVLCWLDEHIGIDGNCTKLKEEFEKNTSNIYLFHDVDRCLRFLSSIRNKKIFAIIQGKHANTIVTKITNYQPSPLVYIFCFNITALADWAADYDCIKAGGIFTHEKDLLCRLTQDLADYAALKVQEYHFKRAACEEWAQNLTNNAKRFRSEQCTLTYSIDPLNEQDKTGAEAAD